MYTSMDEYYRIASLHLIITSRLTVQDSLNVLLFNTLIFFLPLFPERVLNSMKLTEEESSEEQRPENEQWNMQKRRTQPDSSNVLLARKFIEATETTKMERVIEPTSPIEQESAHVEPHPLSKKHQQAHSIPPRYALLFIVLLSIIVFQTLSSGPTQFIGAQGWSYVLSGPPRAGDPNILRGIGKNPSKPGTTAQPTHKLTPEQYVNEVIQKMTLNQKLGQMMIVQFVGPAYSLDLSTMVKQYNVGSVLIFAANQNIVSKPQLKDLIGQMQADSPIPLAVAIDQEGGYVDRLAALDGPRPSEADIGATGDPNVARDAGLRDAQDLSYYGINLNLAPVVDVTNVYNPQLDHRTYGSTADLVTKMAAAYLSGLQKSGKVIGTLKHFPGLGDVATDPHVGVPQLTRSQSDLEQIDWAPYRNLISQGSTVHAIMVTHELVEALDTTTPSSLSPKVVTGILRNEMGFQGVIMTDSLTMEGIAAYYNEAQAAALSVEAGCDLLMGASTPSVLASMIQGIKQAMSYVKISQQLIDDSVRRILLMKYAMGLLSIPTN